MSRPEHAFQRAVIVMAGRIITGPHRIRAFDRSRNVGGLQHLHEASRGIRKGTPDVELLAMTPGGLISDNAELKKPGTGHLKGYQPTPAQENEMAALRKAGAFAGVAFSCMEMVDRWEEAGVPMIPAARIYALDADARLDAKISTPPKTRKPRTVKETPDKIRKFNRLRQGGVMF